MSNPMNYATNPMRENKLSYDRLFREVFVPTPEEVEAWRRKQKVNANIMHDAIARLKKEGKW